MSLSWRKFARIVGALAWLVSIGWLVLDPGPEPLYTLLVATLAFFGSFTREKVAYDLNSPENRLNRERFLNRLTTGWIQGVLDASLQDLKLIDVKLKYVPGATEIRSAMRVQGYPEPSSSLPSAVHVSDVFDQVGASLLILGDAGAGKSTAMLLLCRDLLGCATREPSRPLPAVFNLTTWGQERKPLSDWLVDRLFLEYGVPRRIGKAWVEAGQVLPLLDNLDRVDAQHREACVETINGFLEDQMSLAVCSRTDEYLALGSRLRLQAAVAVQSLTPAQIEEYLNSGGAELTSLRRTLRCDSELREWIQSPLLLDMLIATYRVAPSEPWAEPSWALEQRTNLLGIYVARMFEHHGTRVPFRRERITYWLSWLASAMFQHGQTVFLLEAMQPDWLPTHRGKRLHAAASFSTLGLGCGLICGLLGGASAWLSGRHFWGCLTILAVSILLGCLAGTMPYSVPHLWPFLRFEIRRPPGLMYRLRTGIRTVELVRWSWVKAWEGFRVALSEVLAIGIVVGIVLLVQPRFLPYVIELTAPLIAFLLILMPLSGGIITVDEVETNTMPGQGLRRSGRNAVLIGSVCFVTLITGQLLLLLPIGALCATLGLADGPFRMLVNAFTSPFSFGVLTGSISYLVGSACGGWGYIQHKVLCLMLQRKGYIAPDFVAFLDEATTYTFLRRVGNGYVFRHSLIQDYFATLDRSGCPANSV